MSRTTAKERAATLLRRSNKEAALRAIQKRREIAEAEVIEAAAVQAEIERLANEREVAWQHRTPWQRFTDWVKGTN